MIIGLCGKSGVGKTSLAEKLVDYGYTKVVTDTTRPMRPGEVNEVDYFFDTDEQFNEYLEEGEFIETTSYTVANGETWRYGTTRGQLYDALAKNDKAVIILNPDGVKTLINQGFQVAIFLIFANETTVLSRLMNRGDSRKEIKRRMRADEADFAGIEQYVDYTIKNDKDSDLDDLAHTIIDLAELGIE